MADFAVALSREADALAAMRQVIESVQHQLEAAAPPDLAPPDLAMVFVTPPHLQALEAMAGELRASLDPAHVLGCGAIGVVGGAQEVERTPAVSLWVARGLPVEVFHLSSESASAGDIQGWPDDMAPDPSALLVLADPFSFPVEALLASVAERHPGLPVVGGLASAGARPGSNRLLLDGQIYTSGAVAATIGPPAMVRTVVSQGCRPVGVPLVVTRSDRNVVYEMAGRPALERLGEVAETMPETERHLLDRGVQLGRVIDEHRADFERGDFLIRNVIGGDVDSGAIAVGDLIDVGATVQYQVRDAASADEDLRDLIGGSRAGGGLLFTCNGRGENLFGEPDHDASIVSSELQGAPLAGMFCAGELGPIGGQNFLHGFTASVVLVDVVDPPSHPPEGGPGG